SPSDSRHSPFLRRSARKTRFPLNDQRVKRMSDSPLNASPPSTTAPSARDFGPRRPPPSFTRRSLDQISVHQRMTSKPENISKLIDPFTRRVMKRNGTYSSVIQALQLVRLAHAVVVSIDPQYKRAVNRIVLVDDAIFISTIYALIEDR